MADEQHEYPWTTIDPLNLRISPELVGASLEFELDGCRLKFELPNPLNYKTLAPRDESSGLLAPDNGLFVYGWQHGKPIAVAVEHARLTFLRSPEFERYKANPDFGHDQLRKEIEEVSRQAMKLLLRTIRWKSGDALNGRAFTHNLDGDNTGTIYIPAVGDRAGISAQQLGTLDADVPSLDMKAWREAEQSLQNGDEPPLAFDLFADAVYLGVSGDYRRAYLELAMAAEVHVRTRIEDTLPDTLDPNMRKEIRHIDYSKHLKVFFRQLDDEGKKSLTGQGGIQRKLEKLLEDRNILVHHGTHEGSATTNDEVVLSQEKFQPVEMQ